MTQKLVEMHDMFGSLYQPIPIFDIPCAVINRIIYEGGLPPVKLGGLSSLFFVSCYFLGERCGDFYYPIFDMLHRCAQNQK